MGVNWAAALARWSVHRSRDGSIYSLDHLHPMQFVLDLPEQIGHPQATVTVRAGFGLHTFTCSLENGGSDPEIYRDKREARAFDPARYRLSLCLPQIIVELCQGKRKCYFAQGRGNFLTVEFAGMPFGTEYRVFFDLRRGEQARELVLIVQSAFLANIERQAPRGRRRAPVGFRVLVQHALRGTKPRPPC